MFSIIVTLLFDIFISVLLAGGFNKNRKIDNLVIEDSFFQYCDNYSKKLYENLVRKMEDCSPKVYEFFLIPISGIMNCFIYAKLSNNIEISITGNIIVCTFFIISPILSYIITLKLITGGILTYKTVTISSKDLEEIDDCDREKIASEYIQNYIYDLIDQTTMHNRNAYLFSGIFIVKLIICVLFNFN